MNRDKKPTGSRLPSPRHCLNRLYPELPPDDDDKLPLGVGSKTASSHRSIYPVIPNDEDNALRGRAPRAMATGLQLPRRSLYPSLESLNLSEGSQQRQWPLQQPVPTLSGIPLERGHNGIQTGKDHKNKDESFHNNEFISSSDGTSSVNGFHSLRYHPDQEKNSSRHGHSASNPLVERSENIIVQEQVEILKQIQLENQRLKYQEQKQQELLQEEQKEPYGQVQGVAYGIREEETDLDAATNVMAPTTWPPSPRTMQEPPERHVFLQADRRKNPPGFQASEESFRLEKGSTPACFDRPSPFNEQSRVSIPAIPETGSSRLQMHAAPRGFPPARETSLSNDAWPLKHPSSSLFPPYPRLPIHDNNDEDDDANKGCFEDHDYHSSLAVLTPKDLKATEKTSPSPISSSQFRESYPRSSHCSNEDDHQRDRITQLEDGKRMRIRGTQHVFKAISEGLAVLFQCPHCQSHLQVSSTSKNIYCTVCHQVSPATSRSSLSSQRFTSSVSSSTSTTRSSSSWSSSSSLSGSEFPREGGRCNTGSTTATEQEDAMIAQAMQSQEVEVATMCYAAKLSGSGGRGIL